MKTGCLFLVVASEQPFYQLFFLGFASLRHGTKPFILILSYLNKTGDSVGNYLSNTVPNNLQLTADFAGLLILDNQPHEEIKQKE